MKTKFLVAALACLSISAAAQQSDKKKEQPTSHEVKAPRDLATGQASGRRMNQPADAQASTDTARETSSGMASGKKTTAQDDWHAQATTTSGDPHVQNVSTGDTNGDQTAVRESPSKASLGLRESPSKSSTGKTSVTEVRESPSKASTGGASTRVATGDLNGDGKADMTATSGDSGKSPRDVATGQASGKRQHGTAKEQMEKSPRN